MKRSFKNLMSVTLAVGLMGGAGVIMAGPASAVPSCSTATTGKADTYSQVWMVYNGSTPSCLWVQARLDRYVGGSTGVQINQGPMASIGSSRVEASSGTNAGNYSRYRLTAVTAVTAWKAM